jgi:hypothetical protein
VSNKRLSLNMVFNGALEKKAINVDKREIIE